MGYELQHPLHRDAGKRSVERWRLHAIRHECIASNQFQDAAEGSCL